MRTKTAFLMMTFCLVMLSSAQGRLGQAYSFVSPCQRCWEFGASFKFGGNSVSPQFIAKFNWIEWYLGASLSGNSENLFAKVEKTTTIDSFSYIAEIDSYTLDLRAYFIQPELGARIFFTPSAEMSPYIDLGAFFMIPVSKYSYHEYINHFDSTGAVIYSFQSSSESKPKVNLKDLYQIGGNFAFGVRYRPGLHYAFFGEFNARGLLMGGDIDYDFESNRKIQTVFSGQHHAWEGNGTIWGITLGGAVGVVFYF